MPFAPKIRKQLLTVLSDFVIPQLQSESLIQVLFEPPFDFRGLPHWVTREPLLPQNQQNPLDVFQDWSGTNVTARRFSELSFSYRGISEERVGVTQAMAQALKKEDAALPGGITTLNLPAPAAFYVPPLVPHGGHHLQPEFGMLVAHFSETEFYLRNLDTALGETHFMSIAQPHFHELEQNYVQLLRNRAYDAAQRHLLSFMMQLRDYLATHKTSVGNSAWLTHDLELANRLMQLTPRDARLCNKVMDYVQFHIHEPITLETLAQVCGVTPQRIGQVFTPAVGLSPMRYLTQQRLSSAKMMLACTPERVTDIAQLCGFSSPHSFAVVFKRHFGVSPSQYRRQERGKPSG